MKQNAKRSITKSLSITLVAGVLLWGCKDLSLAINDIPETVSMPATCTASQGGNFIFTLNSGDGSLSPPAGQAISVPGAPFRTLVLFTPNQTGRSRQGQISCDHSKDDPGQLVSRTFTVRERVAPVIVTFVAPANARVGQTFNVQVNITDDPTGPGEGVASGLDEIHVTVTGPLDGPGIIQLAGVPPGPPTAAQGPLAYNNPIPITCRREGDATIRLFVLDAAKNQVFSNIHNMACLR